MKVRIYRLGSSQAVHIPCKIFRLLEWEGEFSVKMTLCMDKRRKWLEIERD